MSQAPLETSSPWLAFLPGLQRRVRAGTLTRWGAVRELCVLLVLLLVLAGVFALFFYLVALVGVSVARDGAGEQLRPGDPVVLAVAAGLGGATILVTSLATGMHRRRTALHRARMRRWAEEHGWSYQPYSSLLSSRWGAPGTPLGTQAVDVLSRGTSRGEVASLTLGRGWGWGAGRSARHAVMVTGPRRFPTLSLTPMTSRDRLARSLGGQDIAVESFEANERWRVRCADLRFAHEVLHPRLLERLDRSAEPGLCFLVEERDIAVHAEGATDLARVESLADLVVDLAGLLPAYLDGDYPPFSPEVPRRERRAAPPGRRR
ncbi:hypothetical protein J4G33_14430 [Actinotalea sp. BY-33]|uniref:DUF3137 domain-containing protein n=1 Tax=Actinotalea soli TaxID=2819234 RepID=A0A939LR54_9CELL|nr:hypothetical protein [Actinotalea soli]MBO1753006.1 hypothetical protein [Actinotalea soli]